MAKSIRSQVDIDNVVEQPNTKGVSLNPQNVFVNPIAPENTRGMQIAKALEKVGGTLFDATVQFGTAELEQVSNLEKINANIIANEHTPTIDEFVKTYDYSAKEYTENGVIVKRRPTIEEVRRDLFAQHQNIQADMEGLTTRAGSNAINQLISSRLAEQYGAAKKGFENNEENTAFGILMDQELNKLVDSNGDMLDASDSQVINFFQDFDKNYQQLGRSRQESKAFLINFAENRLQTIGDDGLGDDRFVQILLGEVKDSSGKQIHSILTPEEKSKLKERRTAIVAANYRKTTLKHTQEKNRIEQLGYKFQSELSKILAKNNNPNQDVVEELINTYNDSGVFNARALANKLITDFGSNSIFAGIISPSEEFAIRREFEGATSQAQQIAIIEKYVGVLGSKHPLTDKMWSSVGTLNGYHTSLEYKQQLKIAEDLVGEFGDEDDYAGVLNQFSISYSHYFNSGEYENDSPPTRLKKTAEIFNESATLVGSPIDENAANSLITSTAVRNLNGAEVNLVGKVSAYSRTNIKRLDLEEAKSTLNDLVNSVVTADQANRKDVASLLNEQITNLKLLIVTAEAVQDTGE